MKVDVTVDVRGKTVALAVVADQRVRGALEQMARDVGRKLEHAKCPDHHKAPTHVRLHMTASGNADLKYESCCAKLKDAVSKAIT